MGFNLEWKNLIMNCVTTVEFSVMINGQPGNKFSPLQGIRQGDPLSLYLFLLVSDVLSRLIQNKVDYGSLKGIQMNPYDPFISHIFFADDTLIFLQANKKICENLVQILNKYCLALGQ